MNNVSIFKRCYEILDYYESLVVVDKMSEQKEQYSINKYGSFDWEIFQRASDFSLSFININGTICVHVLFNIIMDNISKQSLYFQRLIDDNISYLLKEIIKNNILTIPVPLEIHDLQIYQNYNYLNFSSHYVCKAILFFMDQDLINLENLKIIESHVPLIARNIDKNKNEVINELIK